MIPNGEIKKALLEGAIALSDISQVEAPCGHTNCEQLRLMAALTIYHATLGALLTMIGNPGCGATDLDFAFENFRNLHDKLEQKVRH